MRRIPNSRLPPHASRLLRAARTGHLATADATGQPHVIPICFVFDGKHFYSPIDEKPKRAAPSRLRRIQNIRQNPQVSLVIDHYDEDWRKLAYVLTFGKALILLSGVKHRRAVRLLRQKYRQYRSMGIERAPIIQIIPTRIISWQSRVETSNAS
jgi:PPOX class probable F420-dependent enzyme